MSEVPEVPRNKRKRSKGYYVQWAKKRRGNEGPKHVLESGLKGFIITCNSREKECVKEAYNILNEFADEIYGPENLPKDTSSYEDDDDIDLALEREIESMKSSSSNERRFQLAKTKAKNCLFIKTQVENPTRLVQEIFSSIEQHQNQLTRFLLRMIPVEATCKAYLDDIVHSAKTVFENYFKDAKENQTYEIMIKVRNNNNINKRDILAKLLSCFSSINSTVKPDLANPDTIFNVDIICTVCCLSVLPCYFKYKKYNLLELAKSTQKNNESKNQEVKTEFENEEHKVDIRPPVDETREEVQMEIELDNDEVDLTECKNEEIKMECIDEQTKGDASILHGDEVGMVFSV